MIHYLYSMYIYIYTVHACIYWKESRQRLERYLSVQHQGVRVGGGCTPSCTECEAEDNLKVKMRKTPDLHVDSFAIDKGESFHSIIYMTPKGGSQLSSGGRGASGPCPPPSLPPSPPPPNETPLAVVYTSHNVAICKIDYCTAFFAFMYHQWWTLGWDVRCRSIGWLCMNH